MTGNEKGARDTTSPRLRTTLLAGRDPRGQLRVGPPARSPTRRIAMAAAAVALCVWLVPFGSAPSVVEGAGPCGATGPTMTCIYTSLFTVPSGVHLIQLTVTGGSGGPSADGHAGGRGAVVDVPEEVLPGQMIAFGVGQRGQTGSAGKRAFGASGRAPGSATAGGGRRASAVNRLNNRLIAVHPKRRYRVVERYRPGRPWLEIVLRTGRTVRVGGRSG